MARARFSGPPPVEPVYVPEGVHHGMATVRRDDWSDSQSEQVSPMTPKSIAAYDEKKHTMRRSVSPVSSPATSEHSFQGQQQAPMIAQPPLRTVQPSPRDSFPPAHIRNCPPRRPVAQSRLTRDLIAAARQAQIPSQPTHDSVPSEHSIHLRPRSQSLEYVAETYLQDFQNHAPPPVPAQEEHYLPIRPSRPRSISVPPRPLNPAQAAYDRRTCASCGTLQHNSRTPFSSCPSCRGVYYCSNACWANRVCHRSIKCHKCDCTQASHSVSFTRCQRCYAGGREVWYCSDECWGLRDCHVRGDQLPRHPLPSRQMHQVHGVRRQERNGQRPAIELSGRMRHDGTMQYANQPPRLHRDLEAQRTIGKAGRGSKWEEQSCCSVKGMAWIIGGVTLCVVVITSAIYGTSHA